MDCRVLNLVQTNQLKNKKGKEKNKGLGLLLSPQDGDRSQYQRDYH
jgi:hypothetical protein